jgi:translation initiation factor 4E
VLCLQVLHLLGEQFDHGEDICGVACDIRKNDRVVLWTKTAANEEIQTSLGKQLKELLKIPASQTIGYVSHAQAKRQDRGSKEDTYTV